MNLKDIKFELNHTYKINNLTYETFIELEKLVNSDTTLVSVDSKDFESICIGYEQLIIGFAKMENIDTLLNLLKLYKTSDNIIVQFITDVISCSRVLNSLNKIRNLFDEDINILYSVDYKKEDYDIVLFIPVIIKQ